MTSQKELGQDYLARVRYRNDLPPPPGAPKLLEIPHDGLGRFLRPGYASRLVREQPLNIDVDAEGGMPIDMVGVPGYFFGDESAIMAPENPPPVDPKDALLLRPLASLGKPATTATNVSFLRRTEYIGTQGKGGVDLALMRTPAKKLRTEAPPKRPEINKDDPLYIKKHIAKGFDIAYPESKHIGPDTDTQVSGLKPSPVELDAWKKPVHPTNSNLKPLDFYPILPDLEAFTDDCNFTVFQFKKAPTTGSHGHDARVTLGLFRPPAVPEEEKAKFAKQLAEHEQDPFHHPDPPSIILDYDFYVSNDKSAVPNLRSKFDPSNPNRDDPALYTEKTDENIPFFQYNFVRTYETAAQTELQTNPYLHVAMSLVDPENDRHHSGRLTQKAAYYYPIAQNVRLQPQRVLDGQSGPPRPDDWEKADQMYVVVEDANETEIAERTQYRLYVDKMLARETGWTRPEKGIEFEVESPAVPVGEEREKDVDMVENGEKDDTNANGHPHGGEDEVVQSVEERDASGDEDVDMDGGL